MATALSGHAVSVFSACPRKAVGMAPIAKWLMGSRRINKCCANPLLLCYSTTALLPCLPANLMRLDFIAAGSCCIHRSFQRIKNEKHPAQRNDKVGVALFPAKCR